MRLILDTTIVTASARSAQGASRVLVLAALRQEFQLLLSVQLMLKYEAVLMRPQHRDAAGWNADDVEEFLATLIKVGIQVDLGPYTGPSSLDAGDNHVLSLALHGRADGIVTHNIKHFVTPARELGVSLYTPGDLMRRLRF